MIKVLHMIGSLNIGGSQAFIMNLYNSIDRTKIQFDFIIDRPNELFYKEYIEKLGGKIYYLPKVEFANVLKVKKAWKKFFFEHREYKILHSHIRSYASIYLPIAREYGIKTIIHSHSTSNGRGLNSYLKAILQYPLRFQADYFFGCSDEAGNWLFGKKIVKSSRYKTLPNAIDQSKYLPNNKIRNEMRNKLGIKDEVVIGHVGRFHESKNHLFLLDIFQRYHKNNANSILLLVGDGDLRQVIKKRIDELNLNNCVILSGSTNNVSNFMQVMDCFVFPSKWEGLPVTIVEAQAAGLNCIVSENVTKEVAVTELVKYLPIDKGIDIWVSAIEHISFDKKNVSNEIIKSGFCIKEVADNLSKFYMELANGKIYY